MRPTRAVGYIGRGTRHEARAPVARIPVQYIPEGAGLPLAALPQGPGFQSLCSPLEGQTIAGGGFQAILVRDARES